MKNQIENRGRAPIGPRAMTSAERQRRYRIRLRASRKAETPGKPPRQPKSAFDWATVLPISGETWRECCQQTRLAVPPIEICDANAQWVSDVAAALGRQHKGSVDGKLNRHARQMLRPLRELLTVERARDGRRLMTTMFDGDNLLAHAREVAPDPLTRRNLTQAELAGLELLGAGRHAVEASAETRLSVVEQLESAIRDFLRLAAYEGATDWRDLVGPIFVCAMGEGRRSVAHDSDPLCAFVHLVLERMGVTGPSLHTVSAVLRGRRGRRARKDADST